MKMPGTTAVPIMLAVFIAGGSVGFGRPGIAVVNPSPRAERNVNVHERPCASHHRARCGSVTVPLDRSGNVPGTLDIGYKRFPRSDTAAPGLETIVAIEGGPGYAKRRPRPVPRTTSACSSP